MSNPAIRSAAAALLLLVPAARAADYYVSPGAGSNAHDGRTPDQPFRTLQRALQEAADGDTVHLRSGTYAESVFCDKGSPTQPITLQPYADEAPVLTRGGSRTALWLQTQGMVIRGLRFTAGNLVLSGAGHSRVEACRFEGIADDIPLYLGHSHDMTVQGNTFSSNRFNLTLVLQETSGHVDVLDNELVDNYPVPGRACSALLVSGASGTTRLAGNRVRNSGPLPVAAVTVPPGEDANAIMVHLSTGVTVSSNRVHGYRFRGTNDDTWRHAAYLKTPAQGGEVGSGLSVVGSTPTVLESVAVTDNVVSNCARHGIVCSYINDSLIARNTVLDCGNYGIFLTGITGDATQVTDNVVAENVCGRNGWLHGGASGISFIEVGPRNIMRRNFCFQNRQGTAGTVGQDWFGDGMGLLADHHAHGTIMENNVSVWNEGCGIALYADNCVVVNNTLVGNGLCPHYRDSYGIALNGDTGYANNATLVNNILYNNRLAQLSIFQTAVNHTVQFNLYRAGPLTHPDFASGVIAWGGGLYSVPAWNVLMAGGINAFGNLDAEPRFAGDATQPVARHFQLAADSPCLGAGASLAGLVDAVGYLITWDLAGRLRDELVPAIGAFETPVFPAAQAFPEAVVVGDWMWSDWFGWFLAGSFPWIWREDLGFLYCSGQSSTGLWFHALDLEDWLWTRADLFPNVYSDGARAWLWYLPGSTNPRWFFDYARGEWLAR